MPRTPGGAFTQGAAVEGHPTFSLNFGNLWIPWFSFLMHVSLPPELEEVVKRKVASGLYNNASEVIREALRLAIKQEAENEWLKREAAIGHAKLETGETVRVRTKKQFIELARRAP